MAATEIQAIVTAYFEALQTMNLAAWVENFTEDALIYDPVGNPPNQARETAEQFFALLTMAFEQLELTQDHVFIVGNHAAVKWTMRGLGKTGKQGMAEGISVFDLAVAGASVKIQQVSSYWDDRAMMAQIRG